MYNLLTIHSIGRFYDFQKKYSTEKSYSLIKYLNAYKIRYIRKQNFGD